MPAVVTRSAVIAFGFCFLAAASSAGPEPGPTVGLSFDDVRWAEVVKILVKMLDPAEITGEIPSCRATLHTAGLPIDELLATLNSAYGIAFVENGGITTIHIPSDTDRMCTVHLTVLGRDNP